MIRRHIRRLRENRFLVHVLTLVSGAALAQAILFAFTPLLTRLFDPSDFGVFALYTAIVSTLGVVAAWKYELAIMLPAEEKEARTLVWLSVAATLVTTGVVLLLALVLRPWLGQWVGPDILPILFILPLGVFFNAFFQILLTYASRHKEFSRVSVSRVVQAGSAVGLQSGIAWSSLFPLGLVWGKLGADILASLSLLWSFLRTGRLPGPRVSLAEMKEAGRKHYQFPRFQSLAAFMNSLSQNLPAILLTFYYDPAVAGLYALTARVLSAPTQLIGKSTREVFYQRASERYASGQPILGLFRRTIGGLAKVGALPFLILMFITPWLFGWLFGEEWVMSGRYAQLIIPWSFLGFINAPATMSLYVLGLQRFSMRYETALFTARLLSLWLGWYLFRDAYMSIACFAAVGVVFNVTLISYAYRKVSRDAARRRTPEAGDPS